MEKEGLAPFQAGKGSKPRAGRCAVWAASALILALSGLSVPAFAEDPACRATQALLSSSTPLNAVSSRLRSNEPVRILAIGSSTTQGVGASSPAKAYPAVLQTELAGGWKRQVAVRNAGRGGETAVQTVGRLEEALRSERPDLVIWQVGTNDALKSSDEGQFVSLIQRGIAVVRASGADLILLDQQYYPRIASPERYERYVRLVEDIAAREKVPVFFRYRLMREWGSQSADLLLSMLSSDRFHMGDRGYECIAHLLADGIRSVTPAADTGLGTTAAVIEGSKPRWHGR